MNLVEDVISNVQSVLIGRRNEVINIVKGILAGGHILIEDVPGVGKTTLIKALAKTFDLSYNRVQFTPDLLPTDITGVSIFNQKTFNFEFKKGPIFTNILLADEINRSSPKTQAALLQAMEEKQISEGNTTYKLKEPFIVLATQNPIEYEGTFPLPEAQLDRFMIKTSIGYPSLEDEINILKAYKLDNPMEELKALFTDEDIISTQRKVKEVKVHEELLSYIAKIIHETRECKYISLGGSVRASMALMRISQATALIKGRDFVIPEDIKENIKLVLSHRIVLSSIAVKERITKEQTLESIIKNLPSPRLV